MSRCAVSQALGLTFDYFRLVAIVLERFVAKNGVALSIDHLAHDLGIGPRQVVDICTALALAGIIDRRQADDPWSLMKPASDVTLEDAWRALGGLVHARATYAQARDETAAFKVDLIATQALLGLDQSIAAHLRCFRLDCVQASNPHFTAITPKHRSKQTVDFLEIA